MHATYPEALANELALTSHELQVLTSAEYGSNQRDIAKLLKLPTFLHSYSNVCVTAALAAADLKVSALTA